MTKEYFNLEYKGTQLRAVGHELSDGKTVQLVPKEINHNVSHSGGMSVYKSILAD